MGAELNPVRLDLADFRQAENLETAAVGQDRLRQFMNRCSPPASRMISCRANAQVIRVAQDDLSAISSSSRGSSALMLAWVPTGMNMGVSMAP